MGWEDSHCQNLSGFEGDPRRGGKKESGEE